MGADAMNILCSTPPTSLSQELRAGRLRSWSASVTCLCLLLALFARRRSNCSKLVGFAAPAVLVTAGAGAVSEHAMCLAHAAEEQAGEEAGEEGMTGE